ncbi:MAG: Xaa-Pro dipeptidyl-peptidase, partial [Winogradskyella sp.]|nr:Xaa-Pro dipeptidyl-peptidase [Winogradskyella sp.]
MKTSLKLVLNVLFLVTFSFSFSQEKATPVFENGEAQIVPAFSKPESWIRHDLWVETEFDTDGDGKLDRMHVSVTRPPQTDTENLKLPVIYVSSPYFAGVAQNEEGLFWDVKHELGEAAKERVHPEVKRMGQRPVISNSHILKWVP